MNESATSHAGLRQQLVATLKQRNDLTAALSQAALVAGEDPDDFLGDMPQLPVSPIIVSTSEPWTLGWHSYRGNETQQELASPILQIGQPYSDLDEYIGHMHSQHLEKLCSAANTHRVRRRVDQGSQAPQGLKEQLRERRLAKILQS